MQHGVIRDGHQLVHRAVRRDLPAGVDHLGQAVLVRKHTVLLRPEQPCELHAAVADVRLVFNAEDHRCSRDPVQADGETAALLVGSAGDRGGGRLRRSASLRAGAALRHGRFLSRRAVLRFPGPVFRVLSRLRCAVLRSRIRFLSLDPAAYGLAHLTERFAAAHEKNDRHQHRTNPRVLHPLHCFSLSFRRIRLCPPVPVHPAVPVIRPRLPANRGYPRIFPPDRLRSGARKREAPSPSASGLRTSLLRKPMLPIGWK